MTAKEQLEEIRSWVKDMRQNLIDNQTAMMNANVAISNINLHNQRTDSRFEQIAKSLETIHDSLKLLASTAEANTEAIGAIQTEWQAYLRRQPSN